MSPTHSDSSDCNDVKSSFFPQDDPQNRVCVVCPRKKVKDVENDTIVCTKANSVALSLEFLQPYFRKPLTQVSEELGLSATAIKKACRKFGVPKWPYRTLTSKSSRNRVALEEATRVKPVTWTKVKDSVLPSIFCNAQTENYLPRSDSSCSDEDDFSQSSGSFTPFDEFPSFEAGVLEEPLRDEEGAVPKSNPVKMRGLDDAWVEPFTAVPEKSIMKFLECNDMPDSDDFEDFHVDFNIEIS